MRSLLRAALLLALLSVAIVASNSVSADPLDVAMGKALFDRNWIPAPASTNAADGLGPLFTARSCPSCHTRGEGAHLVKRDDGTDELMGAVVRFGEANGKTDPYYGLELQTNAIPGLEPEGSAHFLPSLKIELAGPPLAAGVKAGARLAPTLFGRAAFDQVPDDEILKREDPDDENHDGVRGRANRTPNGIGRFGWKAAQVTLEAQVAHAFAFDIGLSSPVQPLPYGDCTAKETACLAAPNGESPLFDNREISAKMVSIVAAYVRSLRARPEDRDTAGVLLFDEAGCAACHVPKLETRSGDYIKAFTDLLLHDMGPALDDGVGEPGVKSSEWRTAPLIDGPNRASAPRYLHDGTAANVAEAVAKHGGEAAHSRNLFEALKPEDRQRLVDYVNGL